MPARRCQRVALSIFLCFFLRIRLRRFLISDPMSKRQASGPQARLPGRAGGEEARHGLRDRAARPRATGHAPGPGGRGGGLLRRAPGLRARPQAPRPRGARRVLVRPGADRGPPRRGGRTSSRLARRIRPSSCGSCRRSRRCCGRPAWKCVRIRTHRPAAAPTSTIPSATGSSSSPSAEPGPRGRGAPTGAEGGGPPPSARPAAGSLGVRSTTAGLMDEVCAPRLGLRSQLHKKRRRITRGRHAGGRAEAGKAAGPAFSPGSRPRGQPQSGGSTS